MSKSIKVAPKRLTEVRRKAYLDVQAYMKKHGASKTAAMIAVGANSGTYYPAEKYFEKHGHLDDVDPAEVKTAKTKRPYVRRKPYNKRQATPKMQTLEVDAPPAPQQQLVALIGNPADIIQSLKTLFS